MHRSTRSILLFYTLLILISCSTSRRTSTRVDDSVPVKEISAEAAGKRLQDQQIMTDYFNAKAKVKYDDGDQTLSLQSQIRMKSGSHIWISASLLSFEVARMLITPDSVFAINRWEKSYISDTYDSFNREYDVPATFEQLESILLGNTVIDVDKPHDYRFGEDGIIFTQRQKVLDLVQMIDPRSFLTKVVEVTDRQTLYNISASYDDFKNGLQQKDFSYFREYIINKDNIHLANIQVNFTDIDTENKKAPFTIPSHYQRVD